MEDVSTPPLRAMTAACSPGDRPGTSLTRRDVGAACWADAAIGRSRAQRMTTRLMGMAVRLSMSYLAGDCVKAVERRLRGVTSGQWRRAPAIIVPSTVRKRVRVERRLYHLPRYGVKNKKYVFTPTRTEKQN